MIDMASTSTSESMTVGCDFRFKSSTNTPSDNEVSGQWETSNNKLEQKHDLIASLA